MAAEPEWLDAQFATLENCRAVVESFAYIALFIALPLASSAMAIREMFFVGRKMVPPKRRDWSQTKGQGNIY